MGPKRKGPLAGTKSPVRESRTKGHEHCDYRECRSRDKLRKYLYLSITVALGAHHAWCQAMGAPHCSARKNAFSNRGGQSAAYARRAALTNRKLFRERDTVIVEFPKMQNRPFVWVYADFVCDSIAAMSSSSVSRVRVEIDWLSDWSPTSMS